MADSNPTWDIVATVRERPEVISRFVAHYLAAGCNHIHLYFDEPSDIDTLDLARDSRVSLLPSLGARTRKDGKPIAHGRRQSDNATKGYKASRADWIIHLDADEFLATSDSVSAALGELPDSVLQARALPAEAVFLDFDSAQSGFNTRQFRLPMGRETQDDALLRQVYPVAHPLLRRGMSGHIVGKSFVRTRVPAVGGIHAWKDPTTEDWVASQELPLSVVLLHFDAISYPIWKEKFAKRVEGVVLMSGKDPHRLAQVQRFKAAYEAGDEKALEEMFCELYVLNDRQISVLSQAGLLVNTSADHQHLVTGP